MNSLVIVTYQSGRDRGRNRVLPVADILVALNVLDSNCSYRDYSQVAGISFRFFLRLVESLHRIQKQFVICLSVDGCDTHVRMSE